MVTFTPAVQFPFPELIPSALRFGHFGHYGMESPQLPQKWKKNSLRGTDRNNQNNIQKNYAEAWQGEKQVAVEVVEREKTYKVFVLPCRVNTLAAY